MRKIFGFVLSLFVLTLFVSPLNAHPHDWETTGCAPNIGCFGALTYTKITHTHWCQATYHGEAHWMWFYSIRGKKAIFDIEIDFLKKTDNKKSVLRKYKIFIDKCGHPPSEAKWGE